MRLFKGFGVLKKLFNYAFSEKQADELVAICFNTNLNYILKLYETFPNIKKIAIYVNTEKTIFDKNNREKLEILCDSEKLSINHLSENTKIIHAKVYSFKKKDNFLITGFGSPNLTRNSNYNFESLFIVENATFDITNFWNSVKSISEKFYYNNEEINYILYKDEQYKDVFDPTILEGLWEHQKMILKWLMPRRRAIVNVPPGTGKTYIGIRYMKYLFSIYENLSIILLVPTKTLIKQWKDNLSHIFSDVVIGGTDFSSLNGYLAKPEKKILITLYSRFFRFENQIKRKLNLYKPNVLLLFDECHNIYSKLENLIKFSSKNQKCKLFHLGLSATIDTFDEQKKEKYMNYCGGKKNLFSIDLLSFYSKWNDKSNRKILKPINYQPIFYYLSDEEYEKYKKLTKKIIIQSNQNKLSSSQEFSAALERASFIRTLENSIMTLEHELGNFIKEFNNGSCLLFVYSHDFAERIRNSLTSHPGWDESLSAYIYDSRMHKQYKKYAMKAFKNQKGFLLISERMLAEGFDLPKITHVVLHGSHKSERDWIQKIGRSIRYDINDPNSTADIIDLVVCDPTGNVLKLEKDRFKILSALSEI